MTPFPLILALAVLAQPVVQPEAPPLSPAAILAQAREVYRAGPIADELNVQVTTDHKRSRPASLILRLDAHEAGAPPRFRIDFDASDTVPSLIVVYADGTLTAANSNNENDRWIIDNAGPGLASILAHLPPLPIPELHLALDPESRFDQPTPYTPDAVWFAAEHAPQEAVRARDTIILRGASAAGPVEASFDASTLRLISFHAEVQKGVTLDIAVKAIDPGDPSGWSITTAGRRKVDNLSDLTPQRGPIPPGDFVPDISCTHADGSAWSLHQALAALPAAAPDAPHTAVAIIFFRAPGDPAALAGAEASARLALTAIKLATDPTITVDTHLIAALDLAAYGEQWPALQQRWGTEAAQGLAPGWATPSTTINRFTPDAQASLVLIAPDRRLLSVTPLDSRTDPAALATEVRNAILALR